MFEHGRIADHVFGDLRDRILRGDLPDGSRLPSERELAQHYEVSDTAVRESLRALATMGLMSVRHDGGSFVTASSEALVAASITSMIQLKDVGAADVLSLLELVTTYAVARGACTAAAEEIAALRVVAEELAVIDDVDRAAKDLRQFICMLSEISHNPMLPALCGYLVEVQVELAFHLSRGSKLEDWQRIAGGLHPHRMAVVEALEARDAERAVAMIQNYHQSARKSIVTDRGASVNAAPSPLSAQLIDSLQWSEPLA